MPSHDVPEELAGLEDLALDLRWTWSHEADALWRLVDEDSWSRTCNPWSVLRESPAARLSELAADPAFVEELRRVQAARAAYRQGEGWFRSVHGDSALGGIAYFSLEFGLGEALPIYAGGLGVLAGDLLKTASDLAVPVIGIGLLYQVGYFRQAIDAEGWQRELYPYNDPDGLPIAPVMNDDGRRLRIAIELPGRTLLLKVWRATVGRTTLYLLDSNDDLNDPADRGITGRLYDDMPETRLLQEIVLGVGGWRAVQTLAPSVELCHLNEGHAAFVVLERALRFREKSGASFSDALWATRAGNIFTTHTSVGAGFDRFPISLVEKYLTGLCGAGEGAATQASEIIAMARANPADDQEPFNMAYLALRGSLLTFGVSRLHGAVSRRIFLPLFPRWPEAEAPIGHITNGVHVPTWDSESADEIWTRACGKERWRDVDCDLSSAIQAQPDEALWKASGASRPRLITEARNRLKRHLHERGLTAKAAREADQALDPDILTLGFARRFTGYKRLDLLLRDPERLARILNHPDHPAQLIIAGKAHPADMTGKAVIRQWIEAAQRPEFKRRLVFLEDYDLALAQEMVRGVDVWINMPRRPWEACGTSGMKVLANGGLNLSELDGWWDEAFTSDVGWAIGGGPAPANGDVDQADAEELYSTIERLIAPEFYQRDESGIPRAWVARMRGSMGRLTPAYGSNRMMRDYVQQAYLPAMAQQRHRIANGNQAAREMRLWAERLRECWPRLSIGQVEVSATGRGWSFSALVRLDQLGADDVRVELFANPIGNGAPEIRAMSRGEPSAGPGNGWVYSGRVDSTRPAHDYTVRIVPHHPNARIPTEAALILWQK